MTIGQKNRQIDIYKPTGTLDGSNEPTGDDPWVLFKTKWSEIKGETGLARIRSDASAGGIVTPLNRYSFRVNFDLSIDSTMQVRDRLGLRYEVQTVIHDLAKRVDTFIICQSGGSNG